MLYLLFDMSSFFTWISLKNFNNNDQQFNRHNILIKFTALSFDILTS